jgi:hypothetical protein
MTRFLPTLTRVRALGGALQFALALGLAGCGSSSTIQVTGTLLRGGAAFVPPSDQRLGVTFHAMEVVGESGKSLMAGEPIPALVKPDDGTFTVPGTDGYGIPPGKYRIVVVLKMKRDSTPKDTKKPFDRDADVLKDRFSPEHSPIVRTLTSSCNLTIDLDNPSDTPSH